MELPDIQTKQNSCLLLYDEKTNTVLQNIHSKLNLHKLIISRFSKIHIYKNRCGWKFPIMGKIQLQKTKTQDSSMIEWRSLSHLISKEELEQCALNFTGDKLPNSPQYQTLSYHNNVKIYQQRQKDIYSSWKWRLFYGESPTQLARNTSFTHNVTRDERQSFNTIRIKSTDTRTTWYTPTPACL